MKTTAKFLAGALLAACVGAAQALPITLSDTRTFSPEQSLSQVEPFTYSHANPFDASLHEFVSATLTLTLLGQGSNTYSIAFESGAPQLYAAGLPLSETPFLDSAVGDLLSFTLSMAGRNGNPRLAESVLTVNVNLLETGGNEDPGTPPEQVSAVPEPGTLALLGLGLLGGLLVRRREV